MACSKLWIGRRLSDVGGFLADLGAHLIDEASLELSRALGDDELDIPLDPHSEKLRSFLTRED